MGAAWWVRAGCLVAVALSLVAVPTVAAATPRLDTRFGEGGIARLPFPPNYEFVDALRPVRQPDGKLLVAATINADRSPPEVALARFTRNGRPDASFGRRGRVRLGSLGSYGPLAVFPQRDGRILLVGTVGGLGYFYWQPQQLAIVRLLPDGSRDRSFGTNGLVAWNPPWRAAEEWMDVFPGLVLPQPEGRVLVAASVGERTPRGPPGPYSSWHRVVVVRFDPDGSVDESFGRAGIAELDWDTESNPLGVWARLADGRLVALGSRNEGSGPPTGPELFAWSLHSFTIDGSAAGGLRSTGSVRLGLNVLHGLAELVPTRDGELVMIGHATVRRIRRDGSLDQTFGRECGQPAVRAFSRGGAATGDGGVLVTATRLLLHARPQRTDSWVIRRDAAGCIAGKPLRLRGLTAGPPSLQPHGRAIIGALYKQGLALIRIRR